MVLLVWNTIWMWQKIRLIDFALQIVKLNCWRKIALNFWAKLILKEFFYCKESNALKICDLRSNKITWQSQLQMRFQNLMKNQSWSAYAKISFIQTQSNYNVKNKKIKSKIHCTVRTRYRVKNVQKKRKKNKRQLITDYLQFRTCIHTNNFITQCCGWIIGKIWNLKIFIISVVHEK